MERFPPFHFLKPSGIDGEGDMLLMSEGDLLGDGEGDMLLVTDGLLLLEGEGEGEGLTEKEEERLRREEGAAGLISS